MHRRRRALLVLALLPAVGACASDDQAGPPEVTDVAPPVTTVAGFAVATLVTGLDGPTQITPAPDGRLLVAELHGAETAGTGRVVAVDPDDPDAAPEVLVTDLLTPTGVAVLEDELWIMERNRLSRGPLDGGKRTVVLDELPFNGRSEGTLTTSPDGRLLYHTSGTRRGETATPGSATLWSLRPGGDPEVLATGLKNAYGRTFDADGTLWQTEIGEDLADGEVPPDELVAVEPGDDFGWPRCIGDRTPVREHGADEDTCADTGRSHALFAPRATPTSVAVAPWDPDTLLVALWNEGRVVALPRGTGPDGTPVVAETFLTGIEHPQHLLADGGRLLVVDHDGGAILAVTPEP